MDCLCLDKGKITFQKCLNFCVTFIFQDHFFLFIVKYLLKVGMKKKFNTHITTFKITHNEVIQYEKCQLYPQKDMYKKVLSDSIHISPKAEASQQENE